MQDKKGGGLLFGVIVGTLFGVLFAPRKGKEVRDKLKKELKKGGLGTETLKENFVEMGQDVAKTAQEFYDQSPLKDEVQNRQKSVGSFVKKTKRKLNKAAPELKKMGDQYYQMGKEKLEKAYHQAESAVGEVVEKMKEQMPGKEESDQMGKPMKKRAIRKRGPKRNK
jgi:gas vesicle protein